ncbi:MAG: LuxR C-terminal-related transcriptional regulator [Coriobacteriaceae bacterium]|jgi:DNA-binding CsgD family transcriptional regulator|nr:LuxR C-terminal-related transcriptional regulator [Coriobacteriaceae bacterium]
MTDRETTNSTTGEGAAPTSRLVEPFRLLRLNLIGGFGLHWIMLYTMLQANITVPPTLAAPLLEYTQNPPFHTTAIFFFVVTMLVMGIVSDKITFFIRRRKVQLIIFGILAASIAALFLAHAFALMPIITLADGINGIALGFFTLLWSEAFRRREPRVILVNSVLGFMFGFFCFEMVSYLPPLAAGVVMVALPLAESVFLFSSLHGIKAFFQPQQFSLGEYNHLIAAPGRFETTTYHKLQVSRRKFFIRIGAPFLLFGLALGLLYREAFTSLASLNEATTIDTLALTLIPCGVILVFTALPAASPYDELKPYYRYITPAIAVFVLLATVSENVPFNTIFLFSSCLCFEVMTWAELSIISNRYRISPILVTGFGWTFLMVGVFAAASLFNLPFLQDFRTAFDHSYPTFIVVALISGYSLLPRAQDIKAIAIFEQPKAARAEELRPAVEGAPGPDEEHQARANRFMVRCEHIADTYLLSSREADVFYLLAKGRNAAYISKTLYISVGTVHTHSWHIYQKLNVHSQQALMDMVDNRVPHEDTEAKGQSSAHQGRQPEK